MSGYVRIHRALVGHPAFRNDAEAMAFAWMVIRAQWKPTRVRYKDRLLTLRRGEVAISQRDMAKALDRDKAWIERLWKRLKCEAMINVACEAGVAVIAICNYNDYQQESKIREAANEAPDEAEARQAQGTEQVREEVKEVSSDAKASSPRPWALPLGVSLQVWNDLMTNRKRKRLPNTETAWRKFLHDLAAVSALTGIPPPTLIEQCTAKGWGAIYDPREERNERTNGMGRHQSPDGLSPTTRAARAVFGPIAAGHQ